MNNALPIATASELITGGVGYAGTPVFQPIIHPVLRRLGQVNVRKFIRARDAYVRAISERREQDGSGNISPVSMKYSFDPDLLLSLVELAHFGPEIDTLDKLEEDHITAWLDKNRQDKSKNLSLSSLDSLVAKGLHINMQEKDIQSRFMSLFADYSTLLRNNGLSWVIKEKPKIAVGHIVKAIRPVPLQKRIQEDLEFAHSSLRKDWLGFLKHATSRAEHFDECDDYRPTITTSATQLGNKPPDDKGNKASSAAAPPFLSQGNRKGESADLSTKSNVSKTRELPDCLNTSCSGKHWLKNCPKTSPTARDAIFAARAAARKASGEQRTTRSDSTPSSSVYSSKAVRAGPPRTGRMTASFGFSHDLVVLPDLGSDDNVLPQSLLTSLESAGMFVPVRSLPQPVKLDLAVQGPGMSTLVRRQAQLSIEIQLPAGPLRLRNVRWLVCEQEMDEVLLGRPVLHALGIDAEAHLVAARDSLQDLDCSEITSGAPGGRLSRLLMRRAEETEHPSDPIESTIEGTSSLVPEDFSKVTHGQPNVDPISNSRLLDLPSDLRDEKVMEAMLSMLDDARAAGLPTAANRRLQDLVFEFADIWRIGLSPGPPAKLPAMRIQLKPDAQPVRVRVRKYPVEQREFLSRFVGELVANGHAFRNPHATWCAAPLLVPKEGAGNFRFTVDLRPVNRVTVPNSWPMPHLESELGRVSGSSYFSTFDLSNGYWQLALHEDSRDCQSFITPDGVFTPTRVLHGASNAVAHMQSSLQGILDSMSASILSWLDDLFLHAPSVDELLANLRKFFTICRNHNIKLHPLKCSLFSVEAKWCGRIISAAGVRFDPRRLQGLRDMSPPVTGADLQQFVCALNWMRSALPEFSRLVGPLHDLLEAVYQRVAGKRTKTAAAKVPLSEVGWTALHADSFRTCQQSLEHAVTLAHPSATSRLCLYTDASDAFWSSVITQVPPEDLDLAPSEQRHEPLAFLSGRFTGSSTRWPIIEKEAFAIVTTCDRMQWLLNCPAGFSLFTDHNNLTYVFDPYRTSPGLSSHTASKLIRWALKLSAFRYTIEHVPGSDNLWPDLLTRWAAPAARARASAVVLSPLNPAMDADFVWPTAAELRRLQDEALTSEHHNEVQSTKSENVSLSSEGLYRTADRLIWIPPMAEKLQLRICIVAHTGLGGHRGLKTTTNRIASMFHWPTLVEDVKTFCKTCLHCVATIGGDRVPRPLGEAMHADKPNELLHMDFLYMGPSHTKESYLLLLKDDLSGYLWLWPCARADAASTVEALVTWFTTFGVVRTWVSDQGSHFKNNTVEGVQKALRSQHHFTTAYTPWANGTVERACREVLRAVRGLLSEFRLRPAEWPKVHRIVQSVLNNSPSPQRGNIAPITAFTGLPPDSPLLALVSIDAHEVHSLSLIQARQALNIAELRRSLDEIHKCCTDVAAGRRSKARERQHARRGVAVPNFDVGDFVLVAQRDTQSVHKLSLRWRGPRRITRVLSDHVYEVEDIESGHTTDTHSSRLRFYHDASLAVTAELVEQIAHNELGYDVRAIKDIRFDAEAKQYQVMVSWLGFDNDDATWEPLPVMLEDVPDKVNAFFRLSEKQYLVAEARKSLGLLSA